jgi:hypothetical protein
VLIYAHHASVPIVFIEVQYYVNHDAHSLQGVSPRRRKKGRGKEGRKTDCALLEAARETR